jgi:hypothetical protein
MTNGAASSQANGFFGAFLKLSGFDDVKVKILVRSENTPMGRFRRLISRNL